MKSVKELAGIPAVFAGSDLRQRLEVDSSQLNGFVFEDLVELFSGARFFPTVRGMQRLRGVL